MNTKMNIVFVFRWKRCNTKKNVYEMGEQTSEKGKCESFYIIDNNVYRYLL